MDPKVYEEWIPNLGIQLIKYRCIPSFYSPAIGSLGSPVDPLWIPRKLEFHKNEAYLIEIMTSWIGILTMYWHS